MINKFTLLLLTAAIIGLVGCATPLQEVERNRNAVKEIEIDSALFGSGLHVADVTDQVVGLLRTDASGFSARADVLRIDPIPNVTKCLVVDYRYKGKPVRFFVANQQHVSYELLVANARK